MRAAALIVGFGIAAVSGWSAVAAERVVMVGTPVSLVPPDGFEQAATRFPGVYTDAGAYMRAFRMPDRYLFDEGVAADATVAAYLKAEDFASAGAPEQLEAGGEVVFVEEGRLPGDRHMWIAVFNSSPNAAVTFVAPADGSEFPRDEMLASLNSVLLSPTAEVSGGASVLGVFLPTTAPFGDVDVSTGTIDNATLSLTEEKGRERSQPHIDLFFPDMTSSLLGLSDLTLDELATKVLELDVSEGSVTQTTLLGVQAIRQEGRYRIGSREAVGVGYVALFAGQAVVLFGRGPEAKMTPEVIAAVDAAAAGLKLDIPE